jgi:hypothetical protein
VPRTPRKGVSKLRSLLLGGDGAAHCGPPWLVGVGGCRGLEAYSGSAVLRMSGSSGLFALVAVAWPGGYSGAALVRISCSLGPRAVVAGSVGVYSGAAVSRISCSSAGLSVAVPCGNLLQDWRAALAF